LQETLVKDFVGQGVAVKFEKEGLAFTGDDNPMNTLMLQVMGACAQFELSMIRERQREGSAIAKKEGKQIGRKAAKLNSSSIEIIKALWRFGKNKMEIAKEMGVSRVTFYAFMKKHSVVLETWNV
jgi:DNA invertase Pin-like site-specific DNA recombinase